jgi:hypothetical protein
MRLIRRTVALVFTAAGIVACGSEPTNPVPVPTSLSLNVSIVGLSALGATTQITATVRDQNDAPMSGVTVGFASANTAVATVNASGLVTAVANGSTSVTASVGSLSSQVPVNVSQVVTQLVKAAGDQQTGEVASQLAAAVEVELRDSRGNPVPGGVVPNATVQFVAANGGSPVDLQVTANASGRASTMWTLGTGAGTQQLAVSLVGGAATTQFSATATPGPATALVVVSGDNQTGAAEQALPDSIVVQVTDQYGNLTPGPTISFAVTLGGGSVSPTSVDAPADGRAATRWTLGSTVGPQTMEASGPGLTSGSPSAISATAAIGVANALVKIDGDGQTGLVGEAVSIRPLARVLDQFGTGVPGVQVTFAVTSGGGSVTGSPVTTDADGFARLTSWTLGGSTGANSLEASQGVLTPVTYTATGATAQFNLEVRYFGASLPSASQQAAFAAAEAAWEGAIFGDLVDLPLNFAQGQACSQGPSDLPAINETVDDLVIFAKVDSIDGPGGILGQARPCLIRTPGSPLPIVGLMSFDEADLAALESNGTLSKVVLHEMGHVLGIGTLWNQNPFSFLAEPCPSPTACATDPHFTGARAIAAFDDVGGTGYTASQKVPVENCINTPGPCGTGTFNSHWKESVFTTELMTGYIGTTAPMSVITIASLLDMTYLVAYSSADAYTWSALAAARAGTSRRPVEMKDDIIRAPIQVVDGSGRVVRTIRP